MSESSHQLSNIVLPSKFHRPLLIDGVLMRNELHNRIEDGLEKRLTLVSAPAGFGKTTLVNSWLAANDCEVSWLSVDAHDNTCSRFLAYLESTICSSSQRLNECVLKRQNQIDKDGTSIVLKRIFQAFDDAEKFHVLVLDDYHLITNPEVHEAVNLILDNLKSYEIDTAKQKGWHVFILSRSNPPFPIWRWRLNGEVNEIGADDLRFSLEEAAVLLNRNLELGLSLEDVAEFNTRAEGWVAGLQLGAASMMAQKTKSNHKFISELKGSYRLLSDYLIEEVFLQQTSAIQNFLLRTSILESMSSELCNAILEAEDSHQILAYLEQNNVFVVPMDHERHLYRYHNFFSDVLKNRLGILPKEELNALHSRAAVWLKQHGFYGESVSHWLAVGQFDQAAELIIDVASLLLNQGGFYTLGTLLELFPDQEFSMRPWLSVYRAWTMYMLTPDETDIWLNRAEHDARELAGQQKIEQAELNAILGNIYAIRSLAIVSDDQEIMFSLASDALAYLPEKDVNVRGLVYTAMGKISLQINEKHNAIDYFRKGLSVLSEGRNYGARADAFRYIGDTYKELGVLHQAVDAYRKQFLLIATKH